MNAAWAIGLLAGVVVLTNCEGKRPPTRTPAVDRMASQPAKGTDMHKKNEIAEVRTVKGEGGKVALMMAVNINDSATADTFVTEVAEAFKLNRTMAPPETSMLLVTLIGEQTADSFAQQWHRISADDQIVRAYMSLMTVADVIQGDPSGRTRSKASLLR